MAEIISKVKLLKNFPRENKTVFPLKQPYLYPMSLENRKIEILAYNLENKGNKGNKRRLMVFIKLFCNTHL